MSTKHQSSTDPCLQVPRPVQLNSRLIDGIGGIWGYARAYPTAPSSPAVVGAAESTASGQGELCAPGTSNRTRREKPEPRCRCSFGEVERITNLIPAPQPHSLSVAG